MEKVIIDFKEEEYNNIINTLLETRARIENLKPDFMEHAVPYTLENIEDLLKGANGIEKFLYSRLDKDLENISTPELKRQHKKVVEEAFWTFLNRIKEGVRPNGGSVVPAKSLKYFSVFTIQNDTLLLWKGWKENIKESFNVYASEKEIKFMEACEKLCKDLDEIKKLWTLESEFMPLQAIFKDDNGKYIVNKSYQKDSFPHIQRYETVESLKAG